MQIEKKCIFLNYLLLACFFLSGCEKAKEEPNKPVPTQPQSEIAPQKPKSTNVVAQHETKPPVVHKDNGSHEVTGNAAEYDEFHAIFCKQVKGESLNQHETARFAELEDLDEKYQDDAHMSLYKKAHNPDNCN